MGSAMGGNSLMNHHSYYPQKNIDTMQSNSMFLSSSQLNSDQSAR
jgi:hypothetical protein